MGTSSIALRRRLAELAAKQGGYFTASQAIAVGCKDSTHGYHVRNGDWERVGWGIYRLVELPKTPWSDLYRLLLWSRDKQGRRLGVYVGMTAAAIKAEDPDLLDYNHIELCVPARFRRSAPVPKGLDLFFEDLCREEIEFISGLPVSIQHVGFARREHYTNPKIFPANRVQRDGFDKTIEAGED